MKLLKCYIGLNMGNVCIKQCEIRDSVYYKEMPRSRQFPSPAKDQNSYLVGLIHQPMLPMLLDGHGWALFWLMLAMLRSVGRLPC
jgi:hypothetical protein